MNRAMGSKKGQTAHLTALLNTLAPNLAEMGSRLQEVADLEPHLEGIRAEWEGVIREVRTRIDTLEKDRRTDYATTLALLFDLTQGSLRVTDLGELVEKAEVYRARIEQAEGK